jgi:hypothetical protein
MIATRRIGRIFAITSLVLAVQAVIARDLVAVEAPHHHSLHIDQSTVQRAGAVVSLTYVLGNPPGSNAIELTLNCAERTYALAKVYVYSAPLAEGTVTMVSTPPASERTPKKIPVGTTWEILARKVCDQ